LLQHLIYCELEKRKKKSIRSKFKRLNIKEQIYYGVGLRKARGSREREHEDGKRRAAASRSQDLHRGAQHIVVVYILSVFGLTLLLPSNVLTSFTQQLKPPEND